MRRTLRTAALALAVAVFTLGGLVATSAPASASDYEDSITAFDMTIDLGADGVAHVTMDLDVDFGIIPNHGPYLTWVVREPFDDERDRLYRFNDVRVTSATAPTDVSTEDITSQGVGGEVTTRAFKIGSPDTTVTGVHHYTVTFDVEGWVNPYDYAWPDAEDASDTAAQVVPYDELYVNLITRWSIAVHDVTVTVNGPADVLAEVCYDAWNVSDSCDREGSRGATASFAETEVLAYDPFTIAIAYPRGTFPGVEPIVEYRWSVARAFALTPWTVGGALAVAAAGGVVLMRRLRRTGRDEQFDGLTPGVLPAAGEIGQAGARRRAPVAVQFSPPEGFRAGQLGTLVDEVADPRDVTATIIDLAVRGYLHITQVTVGEDWRLERTAQSAEDLLPYESELYEQIFDDRTGVNLSELQTTFATSMAAVQAALYADVTERGWFRRNPSSARTTWAMQGLLVLAVGVGVTAMLAAWTQWAVPGIGLVLVGIAWLASTRGAPARTAAGTAVLVQTEGFQLYLATAEANQLRFEEGEDLFSRYLPFAVAFGLTERWADLFAQLAAQGRALAEPGWYLGYSGIPFWASAGALGHDLSQFASTADTALTAPAPSTSGASGGSGFSGGFGGGGVGGGGGGTW